MTKNEYYLNIALSVAQKSSCLSKQYGAIIVKNDEIIATGYNGVPRGELHCQICTKIHSDKDMNEYLSCRAIHAEMNAIISAARRDMVGSTLYLAGLTVYGVEMLEPIPCEICKRLIKNAGINKVITKQGEIWKRLD